MGRRGERDRRLRRESSAGLLSGARRRRESRRPRRSIPWRKAGSSGLFSDAKSGARARDRGARAGARSSVDRPDPRRERHRKGPPRPRAPRRLRARRPPLRPGRRGEPLRRALRERALRPRARSVHRRGRRQARAARGRRGRHGLPRRGLVAVAGGPGQVPARAPGKRRSGASAASRRTRFARGSSCPRAATSRLSSSRERFRDDFFYRIDVVSVRLPPLLRPPGGHPPARPRLPEARRARVRPSGAALHEGRRANAHATTPGPATSASCSTSSRRPRSRAEAPEVGRRIFRRAVFGSPESLLAAAVERRWTLRELTDAYIDETLRRAGGNRSLAAKRLGVSRKSLWEREKKTGRSAAKPALGDGFAGLPDDRLSSRIQIAPEFGEGRRKKERCRMPLDRRQGRPR